jgi:hypothetical protein
MKTEGIKSFFTPQILKNFAKGAATIMTARFAMEAFSQIREAAERQRERNVARFTSSGGK